MRRYAQQKGRSLFEAGTFGKGTLSDTVLEGQTAKDATEHRVTANGHRACTMASSRPARRLAVENDRITKALLEPVKRWYAVVARAAPRTR